MILIDTSCWIEFFKKTGNMDDKKRVAEIINNNQAVYTCPIQFELLTGARDNEIDDIEAAFSFSLFRPFLDKHWQKAATIEKELRKKGLTIPRDDIFVTAFSLVEELPIYTKDTHFGMIKAAGGIDISLLS